MILKKFFILMIALIFVAGIAGIGFSDDVPQKGVVKGTVTDIKAIEVELTVKDAKGKETKVKTKDGVFKVGDKVVIKAGKVSKEVKPITGGY